MAHATGDQGVRDSLVARTPRSLFDRLQAPIRQAPSGGFAHQASSATNFALIVWYVLRIEHLPLSSIGARTPGALDMVLGVVAALVILLGAGMIYQFLLPALHISVDQQLKSVVQTSMAFRLLTVTRAAVVEETAFRGYGFGRLAELTGSKATAAVATWILFALGHLSGGGVGQVIIAAFAGLVLTALYFWRGNLWVNIIAHWLTDGVGFILLPLIGAHH
jgi:membrane protease YdiL (CAAX protease family)